jgi:hypothetical protein
LGARNRESRPDRFPDGRLPVVTLTTSRWGACAAQTLLFRPDGDVAVVFRQAGGNDRGARVLALRPSLPHARHRDSS